MCLRTQRQAVRVTLKELESLSFDITSADILKTLSCELVTLKTKYQQNVTCESGLVVRPQVHATSSFERARKLKLKYKRLRQRRAPYGSLVPKKQPGRPRSDYRHRNRVGRKASNWRKVYGMNVANHAGQFLYNNHFHRNYHQPLKVHNKRAPLHPIQVIQNQLQQYFKVCVCTWACCGGH